MCRSIKTLFNFDPEVTDKEIHDAALQFVRKLSGFRAPSKVNEAVFNKAVEEVAHAAHHLLGDLISQGEPKNREVEAAKAHARAVRRFGGAPAS
ncbi:MAG TPA: DUF2277 domain-containing protein [Candidatus Saccharimonadales bacterium]|nr:DUF2277 domain-containing protein [Candidatus Saccharimonadales bacterium]